jgi:SAM-dependent methyltransferase
MVKEKPKATEFDYISSDYEKILNQGLYLSGENSDYFAEQRVKHSARSLKKLGKEPDCIMDYGCGVGGSLKYLIDQFNPNKLLATDVSEESLKLVENNFSSTILDKILLPEKSKTLCDMCFCNGVFHHIVPSERSDAVRYIYDSLTIDGFFFFWENNPWNPATHWVMSKISFDRNAVKIFPHQAIRLLKSEGFKIRAVNYLFIFPHLMRFLRPFEKILITLPLGCQYLIIAQRV